MSICVLGLTAIIHDCISCLFIYAHLYYDHYLVLYKVNNNITHTFANLRHFYLSIKCIKLYSLTQECLISH